MPRYFFHIKNGVDTHDKDGVDLIDTDAARSQALRVGGQILKDGLDSFWATAPWKIQVAGPDGVTMFGLEISALSIVPV